MSKKTIFIISFAFLLSACQNQVLKTNNPTDTKTNNYQLDYITKPTMDETTPTATPTGSTKAPVSESITATLKTNLGDITINLFVKEAPETVANFVGLAKGTKDWTDPKTGKKVTGTPLYDGTIFHRVIDDFMIQGGDPLANGTGGPGYRFKDEFVSTLKFDKPYLLAMANSGPATNGSQFFITVVSTPWLNNKHTIFGEVIKGQEVVDKIAKVKTGPGDSPVDKVIISTVEILEK